MMDFSYRVLSFDRTADYWAQRARRHYADAELPEAAFLMRRALDIGDDPAIAMELAEIYAAMECVTAAENCLLRAAQAMGGQADGAICFAMGCCALNRDKPALAKAAFAACVAREPEGRFAGPAQSLLEHLSWRQEERAPGSARAILLYRRGLRLMDEYRKQKNSILYRRALDLFSRSWHTGRPFSVAMRLASQYEGEAALPYLMEAVRARPQSVEARLGLALVYAQMNSRGQSKGQLCLAAFCAVNLGQTQAVCQCAWKLGYNEIAMALAEKKSQNSPFSADYEMLRYYTLRRMGDEEEAKLSLLETLTLDPHDQSALLLRHHPEREDGPPAPAALKQLAAIALGPSAVKTRFSLPRQEPLLLERRWANMRDKLIEWGVDEEAFETVTEALIPRIIRDMMKGQDNDGLRRNEYVRLLTAAALAYVGRRKEARLLLGESYWRVRQLRRLLAWLR